MQSAGSEHPGAAFPAAGRPPFPAPLTPCIGRDAELAQLSEQLADPGCRLLTVSGGGGLGKTRLVLELGRSFAQQAVRARFRDGSAFVALDGLTPRPGLDQLLATTIAEGLGFALSGPEPPDVQLRRYLRDRSMLLVLDNLEQIPETAPFVATLLQGAPGLTVLATSRERLRLRGEHVFALQPLAYPAQPEEAAGEHYSAVQLFYSAARAATPGLVLDAAERGAVFRVCRLVEGLPLGIELAASWTRVLSCAEIAEQLARSFGELDATLQDLPARHQSLRAVFDSSWNLLNQAEQVTLRRLSVFRGSFRREAAAAVADARLPLLMSLVDKSLLRRVPGDAPGGARFAMPETLRQFALEQLEASGEADATSAGYARHYLTQLAQYADALRGAEQIAALTAIGADIEHVRSAWRWAVEHAQAAALRGATDSLLLFLYMRSWFSEGAAMFGAARGALDARRAEPGVAQVWPMLLAREAWFVFQLGRQREAEELLSHSVALLRAQDMPAELVFALNYLAAVYGFLGEYDRTDELCRESLALSAALDDSYSRAVACNILGQSAYDQAHYGRARSWSEQSRAIEQQLGNRWSLAFSLTNLGKVAYALRDYGAALQLFEHSLQIRRAMNDVRGVAISLNHLGDVAAAQGEPEQAAALFTQSLALWRETANPWGMAAALLNLGQLALAQRRDAAAARILLEALRLARETQAAPQLRAVVSAFAQLLRRGGEAAWAVELHKATSQPHEPAAYRPQIDELLERFESVGAAAGEPLSLEAAIDELGRPVLAPPVSADAARAAAGAAGAGIYPAGLTAREVDVLRLVAQGLTDKQVAEVLIVSPRTVTSHLTSIYGKLDINTRSAATRFAVDNGLV